MPAGERSQVWYPEVVALLRTGWRADLSWDAILDLRDRLQTELEHVRTRRRIHPPVIRCPNCGLVGPAKEPTISVRAALLAAARFGIESKEVVRQCERAWARYRAQLGLDLFGRRPAEGAPGSAPTRDYGDGVHRCGCDANGGKRVMNREHG